MIHLEHVSKYYATPKGRHWVLNDVTLTIPDEIRLGVLGPNGAGKSTLMRLFAGVDAPNKGKITRAGSISWPMGLAQSMHGSLTGKENARFACHIQGLARDNIKTTVESIQNFADIGKYFHMPVSTYSSGMKARLNFAIAMAFEFDCYIIDELTAVGDKKFREKSAAAFQGKREKASFIKVSHNIRELKNECNMGLVLFNAKAVLYPTITEAIEVYEDFINGTKENSK